MQARMLAHARPAPALRTSKAVSLKPLACRCESAKSAKAAAVVDLQASQDGLADHLEAASKPAPSPPAEDTGLPEIEQLFIENYYDRIKEADAPLVLVDFYTQWCGPCKLMYPKLCEMQQELKGKVTFYKVDCNKDFKELGKELGIRVAPTFMFYKAGEHLTTVQGAKLDQLNEVIAEHTA